MVPCYSNGFSISTTRGANTQSAIKECGDRMISQLFLADGSLRANQSQKRRGFYRGVLGMCIFQEALLPPIVSLNAFFLFVGALCEDADVQGPGQPWSLHLRQ